MFSDYFRPNKAPGAHIFGLGSLEMGFSSLQKIKKFHPLFANLMHPLTQKLSGEAFQILVCDLRFGGTRRVQNFITIPALEIYDVACCCPRLQLL